VPDLDLLTTVLFAGLVTSLIVSLVYVVVLLVFRDRR